MKLSTSQCLFHHMLPKSGAWLRGARAELCIAAKPSSSSGGTTRRTKRASSSSADRQPSRGRWQPRPHTSAATSRCALPRGAGLARIGVSQDAECLYSMSCLVAKPLTCYTIQHAMHPALN